MPLGCAMRAMMGPNLRQLYTEGVENVAWVEGYSYGGPDFSKQVDHLRISTPGVSEGAYVTNTIVNLAGYSVLRVDWSCDSTYAGEGAGALIASTSKTLSLSVYDARLYQLSNWSRQIDSLDIRALSGNYYIRVHGVSDGEDNTNTLRVYRVWLE